MSTACRVDVNNKVEDDKHNIWCPICEYVITSMQDVRSIKDNSCCEDCWLTFGQMRQKEWKEGWRPDSETLNRYKQSRRIINIDIMKILGE
jgi:protein-arginine kinase activator protein McsA